MTTANAIKQLTWTIGKKARVTEKDEQALNQIIEFINDTDKRNPAVFLKMYSLILSEYLVNYPDLDKATEKLNKDILEFNSLQLQERVIDTVYGKHYLRAGVNDWFKVTNLTTEQKLKMVKIDLSNVASELELYTIENLIFHVKRNLTELWNFKK